jgi:hypothetical protein
MSTAIYVCFMVLSLSIKKQDFSHFDVFPRRIVSGRSLLMSLEFAQENCFRVKFINVFGVRPGELFLGEVF